MNLSPHRRQDQDKWKIKPGSWDSLNTSHLFPSSNKLGIPDLPQPAPLSAIPERLVAYRTRIQSDFDPDSIGIHFFLDDYRFETVWNRPNKTLQGLSRFNIALTPDFSIYHDWPLAMQQWNVYRSRWCGCLWQEAGFTVIPSVAWGPVETYDFCFLGLPAHSVLAVSRVGTNLDEAAQRQQFLTGFEEMVERLSPACVLAYGRLPEETHRLADVITYPTRWQEIEAKRKANG